MHPDDLRLVRFTAGGDDRTAGRAHGDDVTDPWPDLVCHVRPEPAGVGGLVSTGPRRPSAPAFAPSGEHVVGSAWAGIHVARSRVPGESDAVLQRRLDIGVHAAFGTDVDHAVIGGHEESTIGQRGRQLVDKTIHMRQLVGPCVGHPATAR